MNIDCVISVLETYAPLNLQLEFDNSGFLVGDKSNNLTGVLVCVDVTKQAICQALESGCNLIIAHHPIIFDAIKKIVAGEAKSDIIISAIKNNISIYCAHTNVDACVGGLCQEWARAIGLVNTKLLYEDATGRYGDLERCHTVQTLVNKIKDVTGSDCVEFSGFADKKIYRVATVNGCGGRDKSLITLLKKLEIEAFVSSEFKYSIALEMQQSGIAVIQIPHYNSEKHFLKTIENWLRTHLENIKIELFDYDIFKQ